MNEFYEGLISGIAILGGLCAFIYWVFNLLEKRIEVKMDLVEIKLEQKFDKVKLEVNQQFKEVDQRFEQVDQRFEQVDQRFDHLEQKIDTIVKRMDETLHEQANQRKRSDQLYEILINLVSDKKIPKTNP